MKVKTISLLVKLLLVTAGFTLCVFNWLGYLPNATTQDIWFSVMAAYTISLGTVDYNIVFDNIKEKKHTSFDSIKEKEV